ncbi:MAG: ATP synthase F1 subunit epsilon [Candidatus Kapaibacterium sp.]
MAEQLLDVEIVTPQRVVFTGKARSVSVPGSQSPFQILINHAPITSSLDYGLVRIAGEDDQPIWYATSAGFTEVHNNHVSLLVESAQAIHEIEYETVAKELADAREMLEKATESHQLDEARKAIADAENRLKAIEKFRDM